jgi:hypothetical protein
LFFYPNTVALKLVSEPSIADKIRKMQQRVCWEAHLIRERGIDQTRFVLDDGRSQDPEFSFLVVGDSGSGGHRGHNPQRQLAELMLPHTGECRFMLHTGDVIYLVGSSEFYLKNFIEPYLEWLVGGEYPDRIHYDQMVFRLPILPVPGNHDYYDLPLVFNLLSVATLPLRSLLQSNYDLDVGWHGSYQGDAYARAFLDYLKQYTLPGELAQHLDHHYTAKTDTGHCLRYEPGKFTRLPNRYSSFRYGGIDFFSLDTNTFNDPIPLPDTPEGLAYRQLLERRREEVEREKMQIVETSATLNSSDPAQAEQLDDLYAKLSQIEEIKVDLDKQLSTREQRVTDWEQLEWLEERLIESWGDREARGRVLYFHHPPYVTEATKWQQAQTLAVRGRLRHVLNKVAAAVGDLRVDPSGVVGSTKRPVVDLVFTGHAHCLEHLETLDTGHGDAGIHWLVCGGSGFSLRRQRTEGPDLMEVVEHSDYQALSMMTQDTHPNREQQVAKSHLFVGRNGYGSDKRRPYSGLRVDVQPGTPPKYVIRPIVAERYHGRWNNYMLQPFAV